MKKNIADNISTLLLEYKKYIDDLDAKYPEISIDTKNIILIIKYFLNKPSRNEVYHAQTHVANMIYSSEDDSPTVKEILEKVEIYLDKI